LITDRIAVSQRVAAALFVMGVLFIAAAVLWPASEDALLSASGVAAVASGFPAGVVFVFGYSLQHRDDDEE
jgi:hypothetical protein